MCVASFPSERSPVRELTRIDPDKTVTFTWLVELILNYKMEQHMHFLAVFRCKFRELDTSNQGVIPASSLAKFLRSLDPSHRFDHEWITRELHLKGKPRINFSDAVLAVSAAPPADPEDASESLIEALNMAAKGSSQRA